VPFVHWGRQSVIVANHGWWAPIRGQCTQVLSYFHHVARIALATFLAQVLEGTDPSHGVVGLNRLVVGFIGRFGRMALATTLSMCHFTGSDGRVRSRLGGRWAGMRC
jgi:hypothetical protein